MPEFPTGTVTFLFTDIEGSTQLWEQHPEAMKAALARHDALLRQAIEANGGYAFKTVGDAFCAAFPTAPEGLEAALAAQRALKAETWDETPIKVRMALHTGSAEERDGDYFGQPLNRVARLLSAGHGGQTLISLVTQELVRDNLPGTAALVDLGEHRLKDLFRPEHVYQLSTPDLPVKFPPLKTLGALLTNLPAQPTPFVGREREVATVLGLIRRPDVRLVTLTGPGGAGKTRLSLQAAADLIDQYEQGVYFVALDTIHNSDGVAPQIAGILDVKPSTQSASVLDDLKTYLKEKQMLLVLDNFEQVLDAGPAISELIAAAPRLKVMVSSRAALNLYGEHNYSVPPLGLPEKGRRQTVAVLSQYESVALFIQRAKAAKSDFDITEENAPAIAEICVRLDGLPLAIELAAARVKVFPPQTMLDRLSGRLKMLTGGARNLPARQQTIRGTIDWSYDLLDDDEKKLFTRLGVFSGGWMLEAAETVCGDGLTMDVPTGLESLLSKSLIREMDSLSGATRFTMLETIREYAVERLAATSEADANGERHAEFYAAMIESITSWTAEAIRQATDEVDNVRRAAEWSLAHGRPQIVARFANTLYYNWAVTAGWREKTGWLEQALAQREALSAPQQSDAVRLIGAILSYRGQLEQSRHYNSEALQIARACGYKNGIARCLNNLANIVNDLDHDPALAREMCLEAQAIFRELGNQHGVALISLNLGYIAMPRDLDGARANATEALNLYTELNDIPRQMMACALLMRVEIEAGQFQAAREAGMTMVRLAEEYGIHIVGKTFAVFNWGLLATAEGDAEWAARLLGCALAAWETHDLPPMEEDYELRYNRALEAIHAKLDEAAFKEAWENGRAMGVEEALASVLKGVDNDGVI